jgi:hypothetical protein
MGECITQCFAQCLGECFTQRFPECFAQCFGEPYPQCFTQCIPQCFGERSTQCFTQCLGECSTQCYPECFTQCFTQRSAFALNSDASSEKICRDGRKNTGSVGLLKKSLSGLLTRTGQKPASRNSLMIRGLRVVPSAGTGNWTARTGFLNSPSVPAFLRSLANLAVGVPTILDVGVEVRPLRTGV